MRPRPALSLGGDRVLRQSARAVRPRAPPERDMSAFTPSLRDEPRATHYIEIVEPDPANCEPSMLPPEGNVKLRNYRMLNENIRAYTPTGDIHTSPSKGKLVARYDVCSTISPPRARILELLRPEDPGRDALEAIVRPAPRRLTRPLDEDTRRFLQRALQSPSPLLSTSTTPQPHHRPPESEKDPESAQSVEETSHKPKSTNAERSLADELREAEEEERAGGCIRRELLREFRKRSGGVRDAVERERLGRLALSVEDDVEEEECALSATARRIDALLAQSRDLHDELHEIHADLQVLARRVARPFP